MYEITFKKDLNTKFTLFSLTYANSAVRVMSKAKILEILEKAGVKNARLGIAGILLYRDESFMQAIESEQSAVLGIQKLFAPFCPL